MESPKITTYPQEETFSPVSEEKFGKEETPVMEYSEDSTSPHDEPLLPNEDIVTEPEEPYTIDTSADNDFKKETYPQSPEENIHFAMEEDYAMEYNKNNTSPPNKSLKLEEDIALVTEHEETHAMHSGNGNDSEEESFSPVRRPEIATADSPVMEPRNEDSDSHVESSSLRDDFITGQASTSETAPVDNGMPRTPDMGGTCFEENVSPVISERERPSPIGTDHSVPEKTYDMGDLFLDATSAESPTVAERAPSTLRETPPATPKTPVKVKTPARKTTSPGVKRTPVATPKTPVLAPQVTERKSLMERARAVRETREARLREKAADMESALVTAEREAIGKVRETFTKFRESFRAEMRYLQSYQPSSVADEAPKAAVSVIFLLGSYIFLLATIYGLTATSVFPFLSRFVF